jgi:hypothetical protein
VAATSSPPRFVSLAQSHPNHPLVSTITGSRGFLIVILVLLYCLLQILKEIEGDLSGFKCGLAHLFCMYRYTYLN